MKKILILLFFTFYCSMFSQVGIGTTTPNADALLELSASDKGLLISRVALASLISASPLSAHVAGMTVYNTVTAGVAPNNVVPGFYYNSGSAWIKILTKGDFSIKTGIERLTCATSTASFTKVGSNFIWTAGGASGCPQLNVASIIVAPFGGLPTNFITVQAGTATAPDTYTCSKNIISLRVFTTIITPAASNSMWRAALFVNGSQVMNQWGIPPNNTTDARTVANFEFGSIPANTPFFTRIEANSLPNSTRDEGTYFIIEYEF